ncbi:MAG: hypothetical protein B7Z55_17350, partial [Planctomycetales bacterium 12-60-4]
EIELEPAGLEPTVPPGGIAALFSCSPGQRSFEHPDLGHGVFLNYVIEGLSGKADANSDREVTLAELEDFASQETQRFVRTSLGKSQTPERFGQSRGVMPLVRLKFTPSRPQKPIPTVANQQPSWLVAPFQAEEAVAAQQELAKSLGKQVVVENSIGMKLVLIPPGEFLLGHTSRYRERVKATAQQSVRLTKSFWLGQTEVTQSQWEQVMGTAPWKGQRYTQEGATYPATHVSWEDAQEFCRKLGAIDGRAYRLPTEAEWEWSCRAGTTTEFSFGDTPTKLTDYAWCCDNAWKTDEKHAYPVALKLPNPFGLFDMHGNVWEWCEDLFDAGYDEEVQLHLIDPVNHTDRDSEQIRDRTLRGGSWYFGPE